MLWPAATNAGVRNEAVTAYIATTGLSENAFLMFFFAGFAFVAALAFGEDGVECERGLAGARQARKHRHFVAGQFNVHAFEVVFPGAAHGQLFGHVTLAFVCRYSQDATNAGPGSCIPD